MNWTIRRLRCCGEQHIYGVFDQHTAAPHSGPSAKEAISAGSSEKSLDKGGHQRTAKLKNISPERPRPAWPRDKIAYQLSEDFHFIFLLLLGCEYGIKKPCKNAGQIKPASQFLSSELYRRFGITPNQLALVDYTPVGNSAPP
jgi:hypothetical protein